MGRASGIGVLDLTTSSSELIIKETSRDPQISPDGTRLAYEGRSPDGARGLRASVSGRQPGALDGLGRWGGSTALVP
jgi:hypothetical protein